MNLYICESKIEDSGMKNNKIVLFGLMFVLFCGVQLANAQQTNITIHFRNNSGTELLTNVRNFYFDGDNIVFEFVESESQTKQISEVKKLTFEYISPDLSAVEDEAFEDGIYPNPVSDILHICNPKAESVSVYSANGQLLIQKEISADDNVDVSQLYSGFYFVKVGDKIHKINKL